MKNLSAEHADFLRIVLPVAWALDIPHTARAVVALRAGLVDGDADWSFTRIGKALNLSRQEVASLEAKALERMHIGSKRQKKRLTPEAP